MMYIKEIITILTLQHFQWMLLNLKKVKLHIPVETKEIIYNTIMPFGKILLYMFIVICVIFLLFFLLEKRNSLTNNGAEDKPLSLYNKLYIILKYTLFLYIIGIILYLLALLSYYLYIIILIPFLYLLLKRGKKIKLIFKKIFIKLWSNKYHNFKLMGCNFLIFMIIRYLNILIIIPLIGIINEDFAMFLYLICYIKLVAFFLEPLQEWLTPFNSINELKTESSINTDTQNNNRLTAYDTIKDIPEIMKDSIVAFAPLEDIPGYMSRFISIDSELNYLSTNNIINREVIDLIPQNIRMRKLEPNQKHILWFVLFCEEHTRLSSHWTNLYCISSDYESVFRLVPYNGVFINDYPKVRIFSHTANYTGEISMKAATEHTPNVVGGRYNNERYIGLTYVRDVDFTNMQKPDHILATNKCLFIEKDNGQIVAYDPTSLYHKGRYFLYKDPVDLNYIKLPIKSPIIWATDQGCTFTNTTNTNMIENLYEVDVD